MNEPEPKNSVESESTTGDYLKFQLDKSSAGLYETGKRYRAAFLSSLMMMALTAILVFAEGLEDTVTIPVLGLKLNRIHAAEACLVLSALSL